MKTYPVEFLTPCFCAGADQSRAEIRAPSIRGQLRWWFRALGASPEQEKEVFGGVHGEVRASSVVVRVSCRALRMAKALVLPHKNMGPRSCIEEGAGFDLHLIARRCDEKRFAEADLALRTWLLLGGLGFRSNRGAGSVWPSDWQKTEASLCARLNVLRDDAQSLGYWTGRSLLGMAQISLVAQLFDSAASARFACSDTVHDDSLGYAKGKQRLASPLKLKVLMLDGKGRVLRIAFPGRNLPADRGIEVLRRAGKPAGGEGIRIP